MKKFFASCTVALSGMLVAVVAYAGTVGTVQGTVTDPSGSTLESVMVTLQDSDEFPVNVAYTNGTGVFTFSNVTDGDYSVVVSPTQSQGCPTCSLLVEQTVEFTANSTANPSTQDIGTIQLEQATRYITVHVVDQDGAPVTEVQVSAWSDSGWASGNTDENGEYTFAVAEDNEGKWGVSVYAPAGYTSGFVHDVEPEDTGETEVEVVLQATNSTLVINIVDADGETVVLTNDQFGSVSCFNTEEHDAYFYANVQGGESTTEVGVTAGTYECTGWFSNAGGSHQTVTVAENETATIDIVMLQYDATINFRYVDSDGNILTDVSSFSVFGSSIADPEGNDYYGDYVWAQGSDGEATLQALDGYTYSIGGWIENGNGGHGGGDEGGDEGEFGGDEGDFGGDEGEFGGDEGDFGGFSSRGLFVNAESGAQYIQNYQMIEVTADATEPQTVEVVLQEADATIEVTVLDVNGDPVQFAWVSGMEGDMEEGFGGGEGHDHWGNFVSGSTDENGVAELATVGGTTYELFAHTPNAFDSNVLPPARQTVTAKSDDTVSVTLREQEADATLNLSVVTDDETVPDFSFCYAYSPDGGNNFASIEDGEGSMAVVGGVDWYIGCMGYSDDSFYRSSDTVVTPEEDGEEDVTITLSENGTFYEETSYTFSATSATTLTLPDGESTLTIPANTLDSSGNVTVTVGTATGYTVSDDNYAVDAYEFSAINASGEQVTEFSSNLTLNLKYDENRLEELGIDESQLSGGSYNDSNKSWESPVSTTVEQDVDTLQVVLNHFSSYGALGDKGLSAVDPTPGKPTAVKAKKVKAASVLLDWKKPEEGTVTKYVVQLRKKGVTKQSKWTKYKKVEKTEKKVKRLKAGTVYQFRVKACNGSDCSVFTKWKKFTTLEEE